MPLHYWSCFAVVLREIHGKVDICQIDYSFTKNKIFPLIWRSTIFKLTRVLQNDQLLNLMFLFFLWCSSFQYARQQLSLAEVARAVFYTHQTSDACADVCACNRTHQMYDNIIKCLKRNKAKMKTSIVLHIFPHFKLVHSSISCRIFCMLLPNLFNCQNHFWIKYFTTTMNPFESSYINSKKPLAYGNK